MKLDTSKIDLTNQNQKIFAGILLAGFLMFLWWALPSLIWFLQNIYYLIALAIPLVFVIMNPMLMWNIFKQLSWNLTKSLISGDKLGYMYRYYDYIVGKIQKLSKSVDAVRAAEVQMLRKVATLDTSIKENSQKAIAYQEKNAASTVISSLRNKVAIDQKQLDTLKPRVVNVQSQVKALQQLHDLWLADSEDLKYSLDAKAEEYKLLKEIDAATGTASEFLKGNSDEYKIYQESLKQIEESASIYTANIASFEQKARPMIESLSMERSVSEDVGAKLIEEFKQNSVSLRITE